MTPERQKEINIFQSCLCHTSFISSLLRIGAPQHEQLHSGRSSFKFSLFNMLKSSYNKQKKYIEAEKRKKFSSAIRELFLLKNGID